MSLSSNYSSYVFSLYSRGNILHGVDGDSTHHGLGVRTVLYLSSNVKIIEGTGEVGNPYKFRL